MNFAKYNNTYPYPSKADFTSTYYYKEGKLVAVSTVANLDHKLPEIALKDCVKEVIVDSEAFQRARNEYYDASSRARDLFKEDLADELGLTGHPKFNLLYDLANNGDGFEALFEEAERLAELLY